MRFSSCAACFPRSVSRLVASPLRASVQPRRTYATTTRSQLLKPTTLVLIFVPILTGFLGVWQIRRLKWKVALIEEVDRNLAREPMILPGTINLAALPEFAFRRVLVKGTFQLPPILLGPAVNSGVPGYNLVQPLSRASSGGSTILVNRGFITTTRASAIRDGSQQPYAGEGADGEVVIEGMLTRQDGQNFWAPENKPETNEWFWKDVEAMAKVAGGEEKNVQPVLIDAIDRGETPATYLMQQGIPVGRPASIELRNQHAMYAATWLSLSAATTVMLALVLRKGRLTPQAKAQAGRVKRM